jgi:hypothetical protein
MRRISLGNESSTADMILDVGACWLFIEAFDVVFPVVVAAPVDACSSCPIAASGSANTAINSAKIVRVCFIVVSIDVLIFYIDASSRKMVYAIWK